MLVEIEGERVRIFAGLSLRARLVQVLGPVRAWRVAQAVARMGGPVLGVDWGRRRFLGRALGAPAGLLLMRHAGQAAAAPPPPTSGGLPIRRSRRLEGTERAQALERVQELPDLKVLELKAPAKSESSIVAAHELVDGNTLITITWQIESQEMALALLSAVPIVFPSDEKPIVQIKSAALRLRVKGQTIQIPALSVNGMRVQKITVDLSAIQTGYYQTLQQDCCPLWVNCTAWLAMLGLYLACCAAGGVPCCANIQWVAGFVAAFCAAAQSCGPCNP